MFQIQVIETSGRKKEKTEKRKMSYKCLQTKFPILKYMNFHIKNTVSVNTTDRKVPVQYRGTILKFQNTTDKEKNHKIPYWKVEISNQCVPSKFSVGFYFLSSILHHQFSKRIKQRLSGSQGPQVAPFAPFLRNLLEKKKNL